MATLIAGHYDFLKADAAFEQYLIATGSFDGFVDVAKDLKPSLEVSQNGDEWTMNVKTDVMTKAIKFKIGQEFVDTTPSGKPVKTLIRKVGDKMVETLTFENGFQANNDLDFSDEGLELTYTWPGGKSLCTYKRV